MFVIIWLRKILIFKFLKWTWGSLATFAFLAYVPLQAQTGNKVVRLELLGEQRTSKDWLKQYLGLTFPTQLDPVDLRQIEKKLLTTMVFTQVKAELRPSDKTPDEYVLVIEVDEKWTTIPVVRFAFGGGTPLSVIGIYDIHSFGSLWTLGAETRKYGSEPAGGVVWARAPRWLAGFHVLGVEYWREFRERSIYDSKDEKLGSIHSNWSMFRFLFMAPLGLQTLKMLGAWKFGVDFRLREESPAKYEAEKKASSVDVPDRLTLSDRVSSQAFLGARIEFDNMFVDNVDMDGLRLVAYGGPSFEGAKTNSRAEAELYYFYLFRPGLVVGLHGLVGQSSSDTVESQYFLGGLDSVRGLPDGAIYGNRAAYVNFEIRHVSAKAHYCWLQTALFLDAGGAANDWSEVADGTRSSIGAGLRLVIPQVHRLIFRFDYAWSLDRPGTSGITAGVNQLFDPYKPL